MPRELKGGDSAEAESGGRHPTRVDTGLVGQGHERRIGARMKKARCGHHMNALAMRLGKVEIAGAVEVQRESDIAFQREVSGAAFRVFCQARRLVRDQHAWREAASGPVSQISAAGDAFCLIVDLAKNHGQLPNDGWQTIMTSTANAIGAFLIVFPRLPAWRRLTCK